MNLKFLWIAGGIFVSYFVFATLQEKLLKGNFGDNEKFTFVMPLLCITTGVGWLYGLVLRNAYPYTVEKPIPGVFCAGMGLILVLAMAASFMALQWVSYPAQVLAKSSKPIPVMLLGVLVGNKHYPLRKYFLVCVIVFGVTLFFYNSKKAAADSSVGFGIGELLLALSLLMDGLLNSFQERIMQKYKPHSNYIMMESNKWVVLFTFLVSLISGEGWKCINFIEKYPSTLGLIVLASISSAVGQYFIFKGIVELGTLTISLVTTTRKFFTVLSSVIIFRHDLSVQQWFAVICVFSGLIADTYMGKSSKKPVSQ